MRQGQPSATTWCAAARRGPGGGRASTPSSSAAARSGSPAPGARRAAGCAFGCSSASGPGAGASRVAAGMLAPVGEANWGEEALLRLALASPRAGPRSRPSSPPTRALEVGYEACGALHVALDRDEADELRRRFELMAALDLGVEWLRPSDAARPRAGAGARPAPPASTRRGEAAVDPRRSSRRWPPALQAPAARCARGRRGGHRAAASTAAPAPGRDRRRTAGASCAGTWSWPPGAWSGARALAAAARAPAGAPVKGQILTLRGTRRPSPCERIVAVGARLPRARAPTGG